MKASSSNPPAKAVRTDEFREERPASKKGAVLKSIITVAIAAAADGLQVMFPPMWIPIDIVTALAFLAMWGLRWEIAAALIPELVPGADLFPCWMALAVYLGGQSLGRTTEIVKTKE